MIAGVIDDDDADRFFLRRVLKQTVGSDVIEFSYADDALSFLRSPARQTLDLLFVDINMPRMDGFEFANAFHLLYPELKSDTRLFIVSSSINPDDQHRAAAHPAIEGFLLKPVDTESVEAFVNATRNP